MKVANNSAEMAYMCTCEDEIFKKKNCDYLTTTDCNFYTYCTLTSMVHWTLTVFWKWT